MSRYDEAILKSIEKDFKTAGDISAETGIAKERVDIRLCQLRKLKEVIWIRELRGELHGIRPKKYRKSPQIT